MVFPEQSNRWLAGVLLFAMFATGAVWGRPGYRALHYRHYEEIQLPNGAGLVTYIQYRDPEATALGYFKDPRECFSGAVGEVPLEFEFEVEGETFTFLFPGAEAALRSGEIAFVRSAGQPEDESVIEVIEQRRNRYPDLDWDRVLPRPELPVVEDPFRDVGLDSC